jgi:hypothetical protein
LRALQVTYTAEVFDGDEIEILVAADGDTRVHVLARTAGGSTDAHVFLMEVEKGL